MPLNLYIGDRQVLPKDKVYIRDAEKAFGYEHLRDDEFTRIVLRELEHATYVDSSTFQDRLGRNLFTSCLSTGVKTLLLVKYYPDKVIDCDELGQNGWDFLSLLSTGNVYLSDRNFELHPYKENGNFLGVCLNGIECSSFYELNARIGGYLNEE